MIDEKKLLKLMDKAVKAGGYQLVIGARGIEILYEEEWKIGLDNDKITSKIKGKIVEHMDFLPTDGAWMVYADGAQKMEIGTALMKCGALLPQRTLDMLQTSLNLGGMVVYQNEMTKVCAAVPTWWVTLTGSTGVKIDTQHGFCYKTEEGESAIARCMTKRVETGTEYGRRIAVILEALERVRMVGAESVAELPGQEDMLTEGADDGENAADA